MMRLVGVAQIRGEGSEAFDIQVETLGKAMDYVLDTYLKHPDALTETTGVTSFISQGNSLVLEKGDILVVAAVITPPTTIIVLPTE